MKWFAIRDAYFGTVVILVQLTSWWPLSVFRTSLVTALQRLSYHFSRSKRSHMERALKCAFGTGLTRQQQQQIIYPAFREFWQDVFAWSPTMTERALVKTAVIHGRQHLDRASSKGNGVILWESIGFGRRVLMKQIFTSIGVTVCQVHGPHDMGGFYVEGTPPSRVRTEVIKPFFCRRERQYVAEVLQLPLSHSLAFARHLKAWLNQNAIICISGDGRLGYKFVTVEFLGQPTGFATGMVSLARLTGATIVPVFALHTTPDQVVIIFEPPLNLDCAGDRNVSTRAVITQYARVLEGYIRGYPGQFRNWHMFDSPAQEMPP